MLGEAFDLGLTLDILTYVGVLSGATTYYGGRKLPSLWICHLFPWLGVCQRRHKRRLRR